MSKRLKLRHNEYYNFQETLDELYSLSEQGRYFKNLTEIMRSKNNIRLAYRNIKRNGGANTPGVDGLTMKDIAKLSPDVVIERIQSMFDYYAPQPVRRKMIPKPNGKFRPLGIPCIWDRLFQQSILQVLEPICEAKFHNHSYGFRANRSTHHAIARMSSLINISELHHCVDVDIKGFFDNVNQGKLLKQLWSLGIRDKKLLSILSTLIKAEIIGEGKPTKGAPQGGILSPLLSNIVLNELDWWISNQWETFETIHNYADSGRYRALKDSILKEMFIVRYADDFKILCRTRNQAVRTKIAVEKFLKERLHLECSEEKSKVINLKKNWSEFLGIKMKVKRKGSEEIKITKRVKTTDENTGIAKRKTIVIGTTYKPKYVCQSKMTTKAKKNARIKIINAIKHVQKSTNPNSVRKFNSTIIGIQNYYKIATDIVIDLSEIDYLCRRTFKNRLRGQTKLAKFVEMSTSQQTRYKDYKGKLKLYSLGGVVFAPIHAQKHKSQMNFSQDICNFTEKGRKLIHKRLMNTAAHLIATTFDKYTSDRSIEYHDNRISKFISQNGKCFVTGKELGLHDWHCHHIIPYYKSKDDSFHNLVVVDKEIHQLIHMKNETKIQQLLSDHKIKGNKLAKLNELRIKAGTDIIRKTKIKAA
ncbi:group II intron reverse transcriptase/maturase [Brevibacillus reuszeri]|uniref:group II intron reverse transcriptase/maturase n=1 Tax=Brevibacillus reuszeri TaxID=54915 RepID=UPI003D1EB467